jgi:hypothetical protein
MEIKSVTDVVSEESTIVLFTRGQHTHLSMIGESSIGYWNISDDREFDNIVVYYREGDVNHLFKGKYTRRDVSSEHDNKVVLYMDSVEKVGETDSNWNEFSGTQRIPMAYIN